ncbi:hypothetical protein BGX31_003485 [Mortierella sp. GBA43]|nr:hypothetical protein BGX31_003485 [Mortierella sp. GBA43]
MVVMWCLVNGMSSSSAFSVDVDPSATIYDLKEAIKAKKSNDFKDIDADRLTLWRVSIPIINDDENPILLDGVGSGDKKKLGPADELSDVFKEEPPKKTIHILIQCPPSGLSEGEIVLRIPPPIVGINQGPDGSGSHTTRRYLVTPTSVSTWGSFIGDVTSMALGITREYSSPAFAEERQFYREESVSAIFAQDVGAVRYLQPQTTTIPPPRSYVGDPDLACIRKSDNKALFVIEVKRPYLLFIPETSDFTEAYQQQLGGAVFPLRQIFGYMFCNGFKYGILTTFNQTWFIRRVGRPESKDIQVSPTITFNQGQPTLLQCYLWFIRLCDDDEECRLDTPDEQEIANSCDPEGGESDYQPPPSNEDENNGQGQSKLGIVKRYLLRTRVTSKRKEKQVKKYPQFKEMRLISFDERAATFRARWQAQDVIVKKCDIWKTPQVMKELQHEADIYDVLRDIQGDLIPRMLVAGISNGLEMLLVTEYSGEPIKGTSLGSADRDSIKSILSVIHSFGVLHGDIRPENIVAKKGQWGTSFMVIDFGLAETTHDQGKFQKEMEELTNMLGSQVS